MSETRRCMICRTEIYRHAPTGHHNVTSEEIAALFARQADARARGDAAAYAASFSEDCVVESSGATHIGRTAVERTFRHLAAAFPDMRAQTDEALIFGDRVVWWLSIRSAMARLCMSVVLPTFTG